MSSTHLRLLIFLPAILIAACASSSLAFRLIYSAQKLNKQGDNIQPWSTPFPVWNQSIVPCPVLTVAFTHVDPSATWPQVHTQELKQELGQQPQRVFHLSKRIPPTGPGVGWKRRRGVAKTPTSFSLWPLGGASCFLQPGTHNADPYWDQFLALSLSKLLELVMDREAGPAAVHGISKSWTRLSKWTELKL